jgi:hypothetical protein
MVHFYLAGRHGSAAAPAVSGWGIQRQGAKEPAIFHLQSSIIAHLVAPSSLCAFAIIKLD